MSALRGNAPMSVEPWPPLGVRLVAWYQAIGAVLTGIGAIGMMTLGPHAVPAALLVGAVAVFMVVAARALWRLRTWAWAVAVTLLAIGTGFFIVNPPLSAQNPFFFLLQIVTFVMGVAALVYLVVRAGLFLHPEDPAPGEAPAGVFPPPRGPE